MKKAAILVSMMLYLGVATHTSGQNLVQNPGFEAVTDWDSLWILSTILPSSETALATVNTADVHEGVRSAELSNSKFNTWTYFYTDSINAPLVFEAGKSYRVSGWLRSVEEGKGTELSISWDLSRESLVFYSGSPDPVSDPDWFEVADTITPLEASGDGYLSLGFRAGKLGQQAPGILLVDDFSVVRIPDNNETEITVFSIPQQTGPATIDAAAGTVFLEVNMDSDVTHLATDLITLSRGATVTPAAGDTVDFTGPVTYTVVAQDGTTIREWTVTVVRQPSTHNEVVSFKLDEELFQAVVDNVLHLITAEVVYGTDPTALVPSIEISPYATVNPASGVAVDFSSPVIYRVTAEDRITTQDYIVSVTVSTLLNETDITSFSLVEEVEPASIDNLLHTVEIPVLPGTDLTSLAPTIGISAGATLDPASGVSIDFSDPVIYTVTAEDGISMQQWSVTVTELPDTATMITDFTLAGQVGPAVIDTVLHTVEITLPAGTDLTGLVPTIAVSDGAALDPASGVANDFTGDVVYTVTAEDGVTTREWTVTVILLPYTETDITGFTFAEQAGPATIDPVLHTVEIAVPPGTDVTTLVPSIALSAGATVDPASGVAADFTGDVIYTVTAEDGVTTQEWTVSVVVELRTETDILSFTLAGETGPAEIDANQHTVEIEVAKGTVLTALVPDITLSEGATVDPESGVANDFTGDVIYTVTAEDGVTTQDWVVTVNMDPAVSVDRDPAHLPDLRVYPNPATEQLHVELSESGELYLRDIMGRVVITLPDASDRMILPVSHLERGIYFLQYIYQGKEQVFRIILE